jgi:hypothetical protein
MADKVEKVDGALSLYMDVYVQRKKAAQRAAEIANLEAEVCNMLHMQITSAVANRFEVPTSSVVALDYDGKQVQLRTDESK